MTRHSLPTIRKSAAAFSLPPNLADYEAACADFSWQAMAGLLEGLPEGKGLNIAHEAVDRHAKGAAGAKTALRFLAKQGATRDISYAELAQLTSRFANAISNLGLGKGGAVFTLLGRVPELFIACLGTLKSRSVFSALFSSFGPEPAAKRLTDAEARLLVTNAQLYHRTIEPVLDRLPRLGDILITDADFAGPVKCGGKRLWSFQHLLDSAEPSFSISATDPEDLALLHYTSGTTGEPKGAMHVHGAILAHHVTAMYALDLHAKDIFWCTADPGWVTGISYGVLAPLSIAATVIVDEDEFDAQRWCATLRKEHVSVWYTSPTAIRMLMRYGREEAERHDYPALRFAASVGESLAPDAVLWGSEAFGVPFHDNWWQTETGGIMIANFPSLDIKPGSMGMPLPGVKAAVVHRGPDAVTRIETPDTVGELALWPDWPSLFRGYLHKEQRYQECFAGGWYLTGDLVRRDADGYLWFVGRRDDIIKTAGHMVGPAEVEHALVAHPQVAEAGVIGRPDPMIGEVVKAYILLNPGVEATEALRRDILGFARERLGSAVAPREITFVPELPKTDSGKILRRQLKDRECGASRIEGEDG